MVAALSLGARRDRARVGADVRLGQAEAAELLAARERLQVVLLLRVGAEREDRSAHDGVLHADDGRRGAVARGDLLERQGERQVVHRRAVPLLGHHHAHRAELAQLAQFVAREMRLAIPARGIGRELVLRERAHRVAHQLLLLVKQHRSAAATAPFRTVEDEDAAR